MEEELARMRIKLFWDFGNIPNFNNHFCYIVVYISWRCIHSKKKKNPVNKYWALIADLGGGMCRSEEYPYLQLTLKWVQKSAWLDRGMDG